jgi:bifunctional non-homologous end joining protein LigD
MPGFALPAGAVPAVLPRRTHPMLVTPTLEPPGSTHWLHEIKYDGHRLIAIVAGDRLRLLSRNIHDRTALFREPFQPLLAAGLPEMILDGEIAVPDAQGVTHIDALSAAMRQRQPERFAYFAFDLLHLDGHDLRRCALEDRKALLRAVIAAADGARILYVDHVVGQGGALLEAVRQAGGEGIVSKRCGSRYRGGESRNWRKAKVFATGRFVVTGFSEIDPGRIAALHVAERRDGRLVPAGVVRFGRFGGTLRWRLDLLRAGPRRSRGVIPVRPEGGSGQVLWPPPGQLDSRRRAAVGRLGGVHGVARNHSRGRRLGQ